MPCINRKLIFVSITCVLMAQISIVSAVTGRILDDIEAEQADTAALTAETEIFRSIGMGIALSLAQCEGQDQCQVIDTNEIEQLVNTLDERINGLILRQGGGKGEFTDILTAYVDQRENYLRYQKELEEITGITTADDGLSDDDAFAEESVEFGETSTDGVDLSIFEDADEDLGTDDLLEDDFNPEADDL